MARVPTLVFSLAFAFSAFGPLCARSADPVPAACCEHYSSCEGTGKETDPLNASDCCRVGDQGQPAGDRALSPGLSVQPAAESLERIGALRITAEEIGFVGARLESASPPFYLLTHNYRI